MKPGAAARQPTPSAADRPARDCALKVRDGEAAVRRPNCRPECHRGEFSAGSSFRFSPFEASEVGLLSAAAPDGCCLLARRLCALCSLERS